MATADIPRPGPTRAESPPVSGPEAGRISEALPPPPSLALIDHPLAFIQAEHLRHRAYCAMLARFAQTRQASRNDADRLIAFLVADLALHHADENEDLFPVLRRRALPEDNLGAVLAQLSEDHHRQTAVVEDIVSTLSRHPASGSLRFDTAMAETIQAYVARENRHLAIENAVVLTIAAVRLSRHDLKAMSRAMKARRGVGN